MKKNNCEVLDLFNSTYEMNENNALFIKDNLPNTTNWDDKDNCFMLYYHRETLLPRGNWGMVYYKSNDRRESISIGIIS